MPFVRYMDEISEVYDDNTEKYLGLKFQEIHKYFKSLMSYGIIE